MAFLLRMFFAIEGHIVFHFSYGDQISVHEFDVRHHTSDWFGGLDITLPFTSSFSLVLIDFALILCKG